MNILITNVGRRDYFVDFLISLKKKIKKLNIYISDNNIYIIRKNLKKVKYIKTCQVSENKNKYLNQIKGIVSKFKIKLIIPCTNFDLDLLSKNEKFFKKKNCLLSISNNSLIKKLLNKNKMYFFCKKNKISTPKIYQKYNEVTNKKRKFVVKEKFGNSSKGLMIISNLKRKHFNRKNIVQDFIKGQEFHLDILNDFDGNFISCCSKKKISMRDGETEKAEIISNPQLTNYAKKISKIFKHVGNLDCDLIIKKNKRIYFLDFNPRFGGGYPFTHMAGLNYLNILIKKFPKNLILKKPQFLKYAKGISINILK